VGRGKDEEEEGEGEEGAAAAAVAAGVVDEEEEGEGEGRCSALSSVRDRLYFFSFLSRFRSSCWDLREGVEE